VLAAEQIATVLAGLEGHALHPIAVMALSTGARRGELLGLQWGNVDLDAATLRIERSVEETRACGSSHLSQHAGAAHCAYPPRL
jgi:integrase